MPRTSYNSHAPSQPARRNNPRFRSWRGGRFPSGPRTEGSNQTRNRQDQSFHGSGSGGLHPPQRSGSGYQHYSPSKGRRRSPTPPPFSLPGPHPSLVQLSRPFVTDRLIQQCFHPANIQKSKNDSATTATAATTTTISTTTVSTLSTNIATTTSSSVFGEVNPQLALVEAQAREVSARLQGVMWIENIRKMLLLPMRTFATACLYYHKFRLLNAGKEVNCMDAAVAALLAACKIQDTIKKPRDILCAAYNLKLPPAERVTPDNPLVEANAKAVLGFERRMLEASGFDFQTRVPHRLVAKLARQQGLQFDPIGQNALDMATDAYRTWAPLKHCHQTIAIAAVELAVRLHGVDVAENLGTLHGFPESTIKKWSTTRQNVMEVMLDLLELYTRNGSFSPTGSKFSVDTVIAVRITLNQEAEENDLIRFTRSDKAQSDQQRRQRRRSDTTPDLVPTSYLLPTAAVPVPVDALPVATEPLNPNPSNNTSSSATNTPPVYSKAHNNAKAAQRASIPASSIPGFGTVRFILKPDRVALERDRVLAFFHPGWEEVSIEVSDSDVDMKPGVEDLFDRRGRNGVESSRGGGEQNDLKSRMVLDDSGPLKREQLDEPRARTRSPQTANSSMKDVGESSHTSEVEHDGEKERSQPTSVGGRNLESQNRYHQEDLDVADVHTPDAAAGGDASLLTTQSSSSRIPKYPRALSPSLRQPPTGPAAFSHSNSTSGGNSQRKHEVDLYPPMEDASTDRVARPGLSPSPSRSRTTSPKARNGGHPPDQRSADQIWDDRRSRRGGNGRDWDADRVRPRRKDNDRDWDRDRSDRDRERDRESRDSRDKERERERERNRLGRVDRVRDRDRDRDDERGRDRKRPRVGREREPERDRDGNRDTSRDWDRDRDGNRDVGRDVVVGGAGGAPSASAGGRDGPGIGGGDTRPRDRDRDRYWDPQSRDRDRDRNRGGDRDRDNRNGNRDRKKGRDRRDDRPPPPPPPPPPLPKDTIVDGSDSKS